MVQSFEPGTKVRIHTGTFKRDLTPVTLPAIVVTEEYYQKWGAKAGPLPLQTAGPNDFYAKIPSSSGVWYTVFSKDSVVQKA